MWFAFKKDARSIASPIGRKRIAGWLLAIITIVVVSMVMVESILQLSSIVCWAVVRMNPVISSNPERLILCAGDSFTAGKFSASSIQPYSYYLEQTLNRSGRTQWRVLNFSSEYFRTDDVIRGIARTLQIQRPSLVYVSVGMNDFSRPPVKEETTNFEEAPFPRTKFFLQSWKGLRSYSNMIEVVAIPPQFLLRRSTVPELPFSERQFSSWVEASKKQSSVSAQQMTSLMQPDVQAAWRTLIIRDYTNAQQVFGELIKKDAADPFIHAALAELNFRYGLNERAQEEVQWLKSNYENRGDLRSALAFIYASPFVNSAHETILLLTTMMDRFPSSVPLWQAFGYNCAMFGSDEFAQKAMQRAMDLIPAAELKWKADAGRLYARVIAQANPAGAVQKLIAADELDRDDAAFQNSVSELSPYLQNIKIDLILKNSRLQQEQQMRLASLYMESSDKSFGRSAFLLERHLIRLFALCKRYHAQPVYISYPLTRPYIDTVIARVAAKTSTPWINLSINFEKLLQDPEQRPKLMYKGNLTEEASRRIGEWIATDSMFRFNKRKG